VAAAAWTPDGYANSASFCRCARVGQDMRANSLVVAVQYSSSIRGAPSASSFQTWISAAVGGVGRGEIVVRVVDEAESATLNQRYRGRAGATNVLAFPADTDLLALDPEAPLGDLVICAAVVEREAQEQRKSRDAHWAHMAVHGALHLIGFDHETTTEAAEMERREKALLADLGFSDPYTPRP